MAAELAKIPPGDPHPAPHHTPHTPPQADADLVADFLASLKPSTRREYAGDLGDFARFLGVPTPALAVERLLGLSPGDANRAALQYRTAMTERGLATATIARRLAALRSVVRMARMVGRVWWSIELRAPRAEKRRDVRGPDQAGWKRLWRAAVKLGENPRGRRDRALLSLLYDLALRRSEVLGLDLVDVDLVDTWVSIIGKGHTEHERITLPETTRRALAEWIEIRGDWPGPLFTRTDRKDARGRLTGDGLALEVAWLGKKAGLARKVRPHGLRHSAITQALDNGWDVRQVRHFSRHARVETVIAYDDARVDTAADIAANLSDDRKFAPRKKAKPAAPAEAITVPTATPQTVTAGGSAVGMAG